MAKRQFVRAYGETIAGAFVNSVRFGLSYICGLLVINSIGDVLQSVSFCSVICVK